MDTLKQKNFQEEFTNEKQRKTRVTIDELSVEEAIKRAIDIAKEKDIVLVLGKGNETYQKLKTQTIYFNDIEEAMKHLKMRVERERINV